MQLYEKCTDQKNIVAQRNKTRDLAPNDWKPPLGGPYYTKNMKNIVIALTLVNLKVLKYAKSNKGSSIMQKTTHNQRYPFNLVGIS